MVPEGQTIKGTGWNISAEEISLRPTLFQWPTMLRKMWSSGEVQQYLDGMYDSLLEQVAKAIYNQWEGEEGWRHWDEASDTVRKEEAYNHARAALGGV